VAGGGNIHDGKGHENISDDTKRGDEYEVDEDNVEDSYQHPFRKW
jgi:hypothetical protein